MKMTLGTAWAIVSTTAILTWGAYSFVFKGTSENKEQNKAIATLTQNQDTILKILIKHVNQPDSNLIVTRQLQSQIKGMKTVLIDMSNSIEETRKKTDLYLQLMPMYDLMDVPKKKFQYNLMYAKKL